MGRRMEPIRSMEKVHRIEVALSQREDPHGQRMFLFFAVGIRLGLRVGDMLQLRVGDLRGKERFTYVPTKKKHQMAAKGRRADPITIPLDRTLVRIIDRRCAEMDDNDWLFRSRERDPVTGKARAISRSQALNDMRDIGRLIGLDGLGNHTLRKTFGYHYYQKSHDVAFLQEWFQHASPKTTLIYIGMNEENLRKRVDASPFDNMEDIEL